MAVEVGALYRDHAARVWRYVRARVPTDADAEDVTSEVFTRAMTSSDRFDPERGSQVAWLVGIARHTTADWWRKRRPEDPSDDVPDPPDAGGEWADVPGTRAVLSEAEAGLRRHLGLLSEREREAVLLRFAAELSSPEIGAEMGISPTAARMLVHRGVTKLREVVDRG